MTSRSLLSFYLRVCQTLLRPVEESECPVVAREVKIPSTAVKKHIAALCYLKNVSLLPHGQKGQKCLSITIAQVFFRDSCSSRRDGAAIPFSSIKLVPDSSVQNCCTSAYNLKHRPLKTEGNQ